MLTTLAAILGLDCVIVVKVMSHRAGKDDSASVDQELGESVEILRGGCETELVTVETEVARRLVLRGPLCADAIRLVGDRNLAVRSRKIIRAMLHV